MKPTEKITLLSALILVTALTVPAQADVTAYVVHGIDGDDFALDPALPVDVSVGGSCALTGFEFGDRVGPITLPAGDYDISIFLADADNPCEGTEVLDLDGVPLTDGANGTIIAHRTADGTPGDGDLLGLGITASLFGNDFSSTGRGKARVLVHHTAFAPAVDVVVSRDYDDPTAPSVTVNGFTNPTGAAEAGMSQINAEFRPGEWDVALELGGAAVFGPTTIRLKPFTATYIYAVGDFAGGTFQYLVYTNTNSGLKPNKSDLRARRGGRFIRR
ncbi:MAG: DUF4397 domain-containing protein [Acidobacteria bacterium]|nr:DUF4397 domain-containing protein [Acidobacteriota bacterium]NIM60418.1 DUF4397 domain-containing protein [Acidobacteriota bacterium]NIO58593.1 DUF4397 domain-containing protein [Acidobacteriota bacterium]NIQ29645.1 DUF4397 domain-containing protein [Acidobacteriota bacterium]NIQ84362.1 DUF4397 domain-containing protein [Acidobacteriota bacterium]